MSYKRWVIVATVLFGAGIAFGLATPASVADLLGEDLLAFGKGLDSILALPQFQMAIFIFIRNTSVLMISFLLSPILCLVPILALTANGWFLGFISPEVVSEKSLGFLFAGLLPHGILEVPALILGEAAALSFGAMAIIALFNKESRTVLVSTVTKNPGRILLTLASFLVVGIFHTIIIVALLEKQTREPLVVSLKQNLRYLTIAFALLVPAALIETYITPLLLT